MALPRSMPGTSQVHRRSMTVCHCEPPASRLTRRLDTQAPTIRHDLQSDPRHPEHIQLAATLAAGITGCIDRLSVRPSSVVAPCLLGCRGTARYRPAPHGTRSRGLPYSPARRSMGRHHAPLAQWQSSRLLIRGFGVQVPGGAPVLTWGYIRFWSSSAARFGAMFAPRLLVSPDLVDRAAPGGLASTRV